MPCIHSTSAVVTLLIVALTITIGAGTSDLTHAATEGATGLAQAEEKAKKAFQQVNSEKNSKTIRKENDDRLKSQEPMYPRQAKSLARQYNETAEIVARQGGDPQPLLKAAAYFESQSE